MQVTEFLAVLRQHHLRPFGRHPRWRARCPVHRSKGASLGIYAGKGKVSVHCFGGCDSDDVLAALGLTWRDLTERQAFVPTAEFKAARQKEREDELRAKNTRIGEWCIRLAQHGYTLKDYIGDACLIVACRMVGEKWDNIRRIHEEKVEAAFYCKRQGIRLTR